jgi:hypothetical protein
MRERLSVIWCVCAPVWIVTNLACFQLHVTKSVAYSAESTDARYRALDAGRDVALKVLPNCPMCAQRVRAHVYRFAIYSKHYTWHCNVPATNRDKY